MTVIKRMKHKKKDGSIIEADIGALAKNIEEDDDHRFVTDNEKKTWNEKLSKDGDMAESTVSSLEETQETFPKPKAGDKQKTLWGKIVKWQQDCLTKFGNYVLMSMLTNQHLNSTNNIPTSALVYLMQQAIQQNQSDINVLNTKQQNQYFYIHHLFNGEGRYNQTYPTDGKFDDFELFQVVIGWKQVLCFKNWFDNQRNALIGSAVYPCSEYTDFYRFEITFSNTNATSFYTNVLTLRRLYPDGKQEYLDQTIVLNTISGLRVVPR